MLNKKKKLIIISAIIGITLVGGLLIVGCESDKKDTSPSQKTEKEVSTKKDSIKELEAKKEKELANAKTKEEKDKIKKKYENQIDNIKEEKDDISSNNTSDSNSPSQKEDTPSSTPQVKPENEPVKPESKPENKPVKPEKPKKEKVWVVDSPAVPAWDEEVDNLDRPIYEERYRWWIRFTDERGEQWFYDKQEWYNAYSDNPDAGSWGGPDIEYILKGYKKKTIHHEAIPEKGHWEYR